MHLAQQILDVNGVAQLTAVDDILQRPTLAERHDQVDVAVVLPHHALHFHEMRVLQASQQHGLLQQSRVLVRRELLERTRAAVWVRGLVDGVAAARRRDGFGADKCGPLQLHRRAHKAVGRVQLNQRRDPRRRLRGVIKLRVQVQCILPWASRILCAESQVRAGGLREASGAAPVAA